MSDLSTSLHPFRLCTRLDAIISSFPGQVMAGWTTEALSFRDARPLASETKGVKDRCLGDKNEAGAGDEIRTRDSLLGRQELFH